MIMTGAETNFLSTYSCTRLFFEFVGLVKAAGARHQGGPQKALSL
jgi:hypothetical protein